MNSPASIRNHPIHPILIVFPSALWVFSLVCDIVYHVGTHNTLWKGMAFYTMAGGIIGALLAAIPGFIDYMSLTDPRAKNIATTHMALNLILVVMFVFNLGIRYDASPDREMFSVILSVIGVALLSVSGWLGGTLVFKHHVAVEPKREEREIERRAA